MSRATIALLPTRERVVLDGTPTRAFAGFLRTLADRVEQLGSAATLEPLPATASLADVIDRVNAIIAILNETEIAGR